MSESMVEEPQFKVSLIADGVQNVITKTPVQKEEEFKSLTPKRDHAVKEEERNSVIKQEFSQNDKMMKVKQVLKEKKQVDLEDDYFDEFEAKDLKKFQSPQPKHLGISDLSM